MRVVHHHRVHADHGVLADLAAVQHRAVADVTISGDAGDAGGEAVDHAGVLQVGAFLEDDASEVAAQAGQRADVAAGADDHVADQHRGGMHVGVGVNHRGDPGVTVAGHGYSSFLLDTVKHLGISLYVSLYGYARFRRLFREVPRPRLKTGLRQRRLKALPTQPEPPGSPGAPPLTRERTSP
ncbi:hypothetical protein D3C81_1530470 [compost metagenome]